MQPRERVTQYFEQLLSQASPGDMLPSERMIAEHTSVSTRTIRRAVAQLAAKGILESVKGKGLFVPGARSVVVEKSIRKNSAESLADHLEEMIHDGSLKQGNLLPLQKQICLKFQVGPMAVSEAYRILHARGLVKKIGRKYVVGKTDITMKPANKSCILFIVYKGMAINHILNIEGMASAYVSMENELSRNGYILRFMRGTDIDSLLNSMYSEDIPLEGLIFGFLNRSDFQKVVPSVVKYCKRKKLGPPRVLMFSDAPVQKVPQEILLLCRGNLATHWARTIASYLFEKKVKVIKLFVNYRPNYANRSFNQHLKIFTEFIHLKPSANFSVIVDVSEAEYYDNVGLGFLPPAQRNETSRVLEKYVQGSNLDLGKIVRSVKDFNHHYEMPGKNEAWLFSHDKDAADAVEFCRKSKISIPADLKIMGLENNPEWFEYGLSSCGLDGETIGYQMAHALIGDFPVAKTSKGYLKPSALIFERLTT